MMLLAGVIIVRLGALCGPWHTSDVRWSVLHGWFSLRVTPIRMPKSLFATRNSLEVRRWIEAQASWHIIVLPSTSSHILTSYAMVSHPLVGLGAHWSIHDEWEDMPHIPPDLDSNAYSHSPSMSHKKRITTYSWHGNCYRSLLFALIPPSPLYFSAPVQ